MPLESRLFVKTSLVALVLVFLSGAAMAIGESANVPIASIWAVEHAHLAFVGWLVNVVIGVALWMFPLAREVFTETAGRYPRRLPYVIYALLNGGLALRIVSEPSLSWGLLPRAGLVIGSVTQLVAIVMFMWVAWQRVRAPARPAPGVR